MATHNKTLNLIASKLGLGDDLKVLNKAAEFERLLQVKWTAGSNLTDTAKVVISLDLASGLLGSDLDMKSAIKYSGLKASTYTNSRKVVENMLELNSDKLSTSLLCAALQCNGVQVLADKVLEEYRKRAKVEVDLNLPQYVCMAVYHACKLNKVKVSKSKVIEKSRLKPAQWTKLDAEWTKFVNEHFAAVKMKKGRPAKNNADVETDVMEVDPTEKPPPPSEPQIEPYEEWRRRMLETAYKELEELEKMEKIEKKEPLTPRRSPRKTPQKYSPYKSPGKVKGIRLLFSIDS